MSVFRYGQKNCRTAPQWSNKCLSVANGYWVRIDGKTDESYPITALFEQILVEHVAASELRDLYRHKLREIIG